MLHDHQSIVSETLQAELNRQETRRLEFERELQLQMEENKGALGKVFKDNDDWRSAFERKNLQVLTEVSSALKAMRSEFKGERKVNTEKLDALRREFEEFTKSQDGLARNLEAHMLQVERQLGFKADETMNYVKGEVVPVVAP